MARLRVVQNNFLWKQACLQLSVVWLIVELAERRATYVADQRCAEAILFRLDKPSLFLIVIKIESHRKFSSHWRVNTRVRKGAGWVF